MQFAPGEPAATFGPLSVVEKPRRSYRQRIRNLAYINLDNCNGGILRNVGEGGIAVQTIAPLTPDQHIQIRFELLNPRLRMETGARVAWVDAMGQAGLEFLSVSSRSRKLIKDWIFIQLLAAAHQAAIAENILTAPGPDGEAGTVEVEQENRAPKNREPQVFVPWLPFALSARVFAGGIDCVVLLCAVLLFSVISLSVMTTFPSWPIGLTLLAGVGSAFAALYWFLFEVWIGATPGTVLGQMASRQEFFDAKEDQQRFR